MKALSYSQRIKAPQNSNRKHVELCQRAGALRALLSGESHPLILGFHLTHAGQNAGKQLWGVCN